MEPGEDPIGLPLLSEDDLAYEEYMARGRMPSRRRVDWLVLGLAASNAASWLAIVAVVLL